MTTKKEQLQEQREDFEQDCQVILQHKIDGDTGIVLLQDDNHPEAIAYRVIVYRWVVNQEWRIISDYTGADMSFALNRFNMRLRNI